MAFKKPVPLVRDSVGAISSGDFAVAVKWDGELVSVEPRGDGDTLFVTDVAKRVLKTCKRPREWPVNFVAYGEYLERAIVLFETNQNTVFRKKYDFLTSVCKNSEFSVNKFVFNGDVFDACRKFGVCPQSDGFIFTDCAVPRGVTYKYKFPENVTADVYVDADFTAHCGASRQQCLENSLPCSADYCAVPVTFAPRVEPLAAAVGAIAECRYDTGARVWRVVRVRHDKTRQMHAARLFCGANNWNTVLQIFRDSFNPITFDELINFSKIRQPSMQNI